MAVAMLEDAAPAQRAALRARSTPTSPSSTRWSKRCCWPAGWTPPPALERREPVDLLGLLAEEAARVGARCKGDDVQVPGRMNACCAAPLRNLLENARRYGGGEVWLGVAAGGGQVEVAGLRPGPGCARGLPRAHLRTLLPPARPCREGRRRGPGLALVRQIAQRHGGRCAASRATAAAAALCCAHAWAHGLQVKHCVQPHTSAGVPMPTPKKLIAAIALAATSMAATATVLIDDFDTGPATFTNAGLFESTSAQAGSMLGGARFEGLLCYFACDYHAPYSATLTVGGGVLARGATA
jgi:hypothetical protein